MSSSPDKRCYVGIDVGTGSARAGVFDGHGKMLAAASREIRIWRPQADFVEQSSDDIWRAVCAAVKQALSDADVKPERFVETARQHDASVVGMSALLTTTMPAMKTTIEALEEAGLRDSVKIMVGGAPVTAAFAEQIGADAYAPDAASAVDVARSLAG